MWKVIGFWTLALLIVAAASSSTFAERSEGGHFNEKAELFSRIDSNGDRRLNEQEYVNEKAGKNRARARRNFIRMDHNGDGWVTQGEYDRHERNSRLWPGS